MKLWFDKYFYYCALGIIVIVSFRLYGYVFYPALNSDHAVTILMAHQFELPHDLYFWGQDRYGSIVQMLAQLPICLGADVIWSVSITHYVILLVGFLCAAAFIKHKFWKVCAAIIWFLPPTHMLDVLQFWSGLEYSFLFICCYFAQKVLVSSRLIDSFIYGWLACVCAGVAYWISELAIVSLAAFFCVIVLRYRLNLDSWSAKKSLVIIGIAAAACICTYYFIDFAKSQADSHREYVRFAALQEIGHSVKVFAQTFFNFFLFKSNEPFSSIYCYLMILLSSVLLLKSNDLFKSIKDNFLSTFLLADSILVLGAVLCSSHVADNLVQRRFFNPTYISLCLFFISAVSVISFAGRFHTRIFRSATIITLLVGGLGSYYHISCIWPATLKSRLDESREFTSLGNIGIIGNYWNTYIVSCVDPQHIKAMPEYAPDARDKSAALQVFQQPRLFVIRDMWLETFPDTLSVHNRKLTKQGEAFRLGGCDVCEYKVAN